MTLLRSAGALVAAALLCFIAAARGEKSPLKPDATSASGQFVITVVPPNPAFYRRPEASTNSDTLRLEAPWLAVSAERFKRVLGHELGMPAGSTWSGKVFIILHSAGSLDEPVFITSQPFIQTWNYRLEMPDMIASSRYARALSAVLLLELANRQAPVTGRSAELPAWLVDGLSRQALGLEANGVIVSTPTNILNGIAETRVNEERRGHDPLAAARRVLQNNTVLTFDQLSWPDEAQLNGADGGVYQASAQLFVSELLELKDGPDRLHDLLTRLPTCRNWQSAFFAAFVEQFQSPLEVEKWWSLRILAFAAHAPGAQWSPAVSRERLDTLLTVPVEVRYAPDALPTRAELSLQAALPGFDPAGQADTLRVKLRDLELALLRLAPQLAVVAEGYRNAIADSLGESKSKGKAKSSGRPPSRRAPSDLKGLLKKLDALDERRREAEIRMESAVPRLPGSMPH